MNKKILVFVILSIFLSSILTIPIGKSLKIEMKEQNLKNSFFIQSADTLPSYFSWRDRDGVDFVTPIRNQAPYSSCETFAIVAAVETMVQYKTGIVFDCDLSEAHLYFNSNPKLGSGSFPDTNLNYLKEHGIPDESCWPYPKDGEMHYPNETCSCWENRAVKITDWEFLPADQIAIKNALIKYGPIPTYISCFQDFMIYRGGVYRHTWGKPIAPHLVTIIGYNDDPGYWIVKNSWGKKWGEDGWFGIEYGQNSIEEYSILIKDVYGKFPITYVDDDNTKGPWDGTKENPYMTIQQGIDNSYAGYTVYVKNGIYKENIIVNKIINLNGEDQTNTIIDGNGKNNVVNITAKNVEISGFTIKNSGQGEFDAGVVVRSKYLMSDANATITDNIIHNNTLGVFLYTGCSNIIKSNLIKNNDKGIYLFTTINNFIEENTILNNEIHGIQSEWGQSTYIGNVIADNSNCGVYLRGASNENIIKGGNTIKNNDIGIKLFHSNKNIITGNNFIDNQKHATFIDSYLNKWRRNYWDDHEKIFPKIIQGKIGKNEITWVNLDLFPSKNPL